MNLALPTASALFIALLLSSCVPLKREANSVPFTSKRWLSKQPCALPCFEGITPGVTDIATANRLLDGNPLVYRVDPAYDGGVAWRWKDETYASERDYPDWNLSGQMTAEKGLVDTLGAQYPSGFTLLEIEKSYGAPTHIYLVESFGRRSAGKRDYTILIVYMDAGFFIGADVDRSVINAPLIKALPARYSWISVFGKKPFRDGSVEKRRLAAWSPTWSLIDYCKKFLDSSDCAEVG